MKLFIFIAIVLSFSTFACTDFSGAFANSAGDINILTQKGCESIKFKDIVTDEEMELIFGADYKYIKTMQDGGTELTILAKGGLNEDKLEINALFTMLGVPVAANVTFSFDGNNVLHSVSSTFDMDGKLVDKVEETYTRVSE